MVAGTGMKCVKYLMFFFNLLFLIAGLAMIIIGAIAQSQSHDFKVVNAGNGGPIFIMVIGGIIFIVAFFGCCGAIKENRCMLITFGVLLIIILILSIAAIITAYVYRNKADALLRDGMIVSLKNYDVKKMDDDYFFWNVTQRVALCCGVDNSTDWKLNPKLSNSSSVPDSCCMNYTTYTGCGSNYFNAPKPGVSLFPRGCHQGLKENYKFKMMVVGAIAICVAILMVIGIALAFGLAHAIHKGYNVV